MITVYDNYSREELISALLERDDYIDALENKINRLKQEQSDKIAKDFEDNKRLASNIIFNLIKEATHED